MRRARDGRYRAWRGEAQAHAKAEFDGWLRIGRATRASARRAILMQHFHMDAPLVNRWMRDVVTRGMLLWEPTIAHWRGQTPPVQQDRVPDTGFPTDRRLGGGRLERQSRPTAVPQQRPPSHGRRHDHRGAIRHASARSGDWIFSLASRPCSGRPQIMISPVRTHGPDGRSGMQGHDR